MIDTKAIKEFDWVMFVSVLLLVGIGVTFIWSAKYMEAAGDGLLRILSVPQVRFQLQFAGLGVVLFIFLLKVDIQTFCRYAYVLYGFGVVLLVYVLLKGSEAKGAARWIEVAGQRFQPSEFMKVALVLCLARYLRNRDTQRMLTGLVPPLLLTLAPMGLILLQPDLGTSLVMAPVPFVLLYAAGARLRHLLPVLGLGLAAMPTLLFLHHLGYKLFLKEYQWARITSFLNPQSDAAGSGYQIIQSLIAIGSGGLLGKGLGEGTQNRLNFLPERHTDFIFSVIGEEWGFMGAVGVLLLYALVFVGGIGIAARTKDPFGRLLAVGMMVILGVQVLINVGMTMRLCPVTGLTLPFISYGGSSLLTSFIMVSLVVSVGMRQPLLLAKEKTFE
jgi:rod shape determining protein RodA